MQYFQFLLNLFSCHTCDYYFCYTLYILSHLDCSRNLRSSIRTCRPMNERERNVTEGVAIDRYCSGLEFSQTIEISPRVNLISSSEFFSTPSSPIYIMLSKRTFLHRGRRTSTVFDHSHYLRNERRLFVLSANSSVVTYSSAVCYCVNE